MRDRIAIDISGNNISAYEAWIAKGTYYCAHPGCSARVHAQWGPRHKEIFFYKNAGTDNCHDHRLEGDKTVLTIRQPVSRLIDRILCPQGCITTKKKINRKTVVVTGTTHPTTPVEYITKFRNISSLPEIYRSGICAIPGVYKWIVDGEQVGQFLNTYIDRLFLFNNVFVNSSSPSILQGEHIMELNPDYATEIGIRAFQACDITINHETHHAYINVNIIIPDASLRRNIIKRCLTHPKHRLLVCSSFRELSRPSIGKDGIYRATYVCIINYPTQAAISPHPIAEKSTSD